MKWLKENGCKLDAGVTAAASASGKLELLVWLREEMKCAWNGRVTENAAREGHLEVLRWARENGCPCNKPACHAAARAGRVDMLRLLREPPKPCSWDSETIIQAIVGGHLETVQWLKEQGCKWNGASIVNTAAKEGQIHILQWLLDNGDGVTVDTACIAAEGGQLKVLELLKQVESQWMRV